MKGKLLLSGVLIILILAAGQIPKTLVAQTTSVCYTRPTYRMYQDSVSCQGELTLNGVQEVYFELPLIASDVLVAVGDTVLKDQPLATIDQGLTRAIWQSSQQVGFPQLDTQEIDQLLAQLGIGSAQLTDLLQQYALSSASQLDELQEELSGLLTQDDDDSQMAYLPYQLLSPMDGIVLQVNLQQNQLSDVQQPLFVVGNPSDYCAVVQVGEEQVEQLAVGDTAVFTLSAVPQHSYQAHITKIHPIAQKSLQGQSVARTVTVELTIDDPDEHLKQGYSLQAEIFYNQPQQSMVIPYEAVCQDTQNQEYVYLYEQGKAVRRTIQTGQEYANGVQVVDGLHQQDIVLIYNEEEHPQTVLLKEEFYVD